MDTTLRISKAVPTRAVGPEKSTSDARMPAQRKDMPRTSSRLLKIDPITTVGTRSASVSLTNVDQWLTRVMHSCQIALSVFLFE